MSVASLHSLVTSANDPARVDTAALPLLQGLTGLIPEGGLRRGSTVAVEGTTSLALALLAGPAQAGSWCAVVGAPELGLLAAAEYGIALDRLALIPQPGQAWASVVAALVDAFDVVAIRPAGPVPPGLASRLTARLRKHGGVLVSLGPWEGADLRLTAVDERWDGLDQGHGRLRARQVRVRVGGRRGVAIAPRDEWVWLPAPGGGVAPAPARVRVLEAV
ncbi:MAG: hypothetical protein L0Y54_00830 [Sporichthyaceae bacterium]|nr:hypothetical protein [Sporichthyaceae bacterium]